MTQKKTVFSEPISSMTVSEQVYNKIKTAIINGDFAPGERIVQENLTEQFNVSRTPVREALQRLSSEGLIVIKPFYGAMVFDASINELQEIYEIRILIECYAARKICSSLSKEDIDRLEAINQTIKDNRDNLSLCMSSDRSFHQALCSVGLTEYTLQVLSGLWNKCDPYKSMYLSSSKNLSLMIEEHDQIVACLRSRNPDGLERAIRCHLKDVVDKISAENAEKDIRNKKKSPQ